LFSTIEPAPQPFSFNQNFNTMIASSILTASGTRYELTGLVKESLDVTLAALPMLHGQTPDVAYKAEGGEGGMKKEGEQAATVSQVAQGRWHILRRHQHHQRLAKIARYLLEHEAVVRVDDDEERLPGERIEITRVQAMRLLATGRPLPVLGIPLAARGHAAQVVPHCTIARFYQHRAILRSPSRQMEMSGNFEEISKFCSLFVYLSAKYFAGFTSSFKNELHFD